MTGTNGKTTSTFLLRSLLDGGRPLGGARRHSRVGRRRRRARGAAHDAGGDRPPAALPRDARRGRPERRRRGVVSRIDAAPTRPGALRRARLHEPLAGSPRPARDDGGLLPGEAPPVHRRPAAARGGERRRRARPQARARARGDAAGRRSSRSGSPMRRRSGPRGSRSAPSGSRFTAGGIEIETPLRGRFNVENVLGAIAAGILLDVDDDEIAEGIRAMTGVPGRFEAIDEGQPYRGHRRLRAHAGLARHRAPGGARARRRARDLRLRRRWRPRPGQAADHGRGRGAAGRSRHRHLRQPAQRGSARDHPGHPPGRRGRRRDRSRPALGDPSCGLAR